MTDYTSSDILSFSNNQQPLQVGAAFDALMKDRAAALIDAHAQTFAAFEAPEEDDDQLELDLPEDEVDSDIEDLDIDLDDLDDIDVDDDLADLDDLEIESDEDITDEDA